MTKKTYWAFALFIVLIACFFYPKEGRKDVGSSRPKLPSSQTISYANRQIIDHNKQPVQRLPASTGYVNAPSPEWQDKLEESLKEQGGSRIKEIVIKKEKSLVWHRDTNPLYVESVIITMKDQQNVEASFKALVDSQTGKVLESWDRSIFDPADVRAGVHIKLDHRYSN